LVVANGGSCLTVSLRGQSQPAIFVDGDICDPRAFNEQEAFNKIDAFIETMDYYREIRKKEGFGW
jgi:hypothetical protein